MVGVCDGHGIHGHLVSNYVKVNLPKILLELNTTDDLYGKPTKLLIEFLNNLIGIFKNLLVIYATNIL